MSTTWVFIGLLAGRELAMSIDLKHRKLRDTHLVILSDAGKALAGLLVGLLIATLATQV